MHDLSDEQLMQAYAQGKAQAFELLYARYRGPLYRFILRQVSDAAIANDLYQGSWEKIIKARQKFSPSTPFKAWMYRIARNHVIDHYRSEAHQSNISGPESGLAFTPEPSAGPEELLQLEEDHMSLQQAIETLPAEQKETLLLKLEGGLNLYEIADITQVTAETTKSRLRYALKKLKPLMQAQQSNAGGTHEHI